MTDNKPSAKLQFHYLKSPTYREYACHGVLGGGTPQGHLWMALFSERQPIPRVVEYEVSASGDGTIEFDESKSKPSKIDSRQGVIRHVESSVYLDLETAKRVHAWLGERITQMQRQNKKK